MELVAAAKMRKATANVLATRGYADRASGETILKLIFGIRIDKQIVIIN